MTGGPGFGKTTIVKAILRILAAKDAGLLLCADGRLMGPTADDPTSDADQGLAGQPTNRRAWRNCNYKGTGHQEGREGLLFMPTNLTKGIDVSTIRS